MINLFDFLFPRHCLGCGQTGNYFCSACLDKIVLEPKRICPVCTRPAIGGLTHFGCRGEYTLSGLTSVFAYRGIIKRAITKLKYRFVSDLAEDLRELFISFVGEDKFFTRYCQQNPVVIPIPLHPSRKRWRGFNQSEMIGRAIAESLGLRFALGALSRVRVTQPQMELKKSMRAANVKAAFAVDNNSGFAILDSTIILFDDVWTTGSTLREAGKALKKAGAKQVWGLTLAR